MRNNDLKPLISILTPSWDRAEFLPKLIQSLKSQTFQKFEWIIGNDGSTDNTTKIIYEFNH